MYTNINISTLIYTPLLHKILRNRIVYLFTPNSAEIILPNRRSNLVTIFHSFNSLTHFPEERQIWTMIIMQQQWLVTTNKNIILDMVHCFAFFKLHISETAFSSSDIRMGRFIPSCWSDQKELVQSLDTSSSIQITYSFNVKYQQEARDKTRKITNKNYDIHKKRELKST